MPKETPDTIDEAQGAKFARYVAGRSSPAEEAEVRAWIAADPVRAELVESLQQVWELAGRPSAEWDVDGAWQELRARRRARPSRRQTNPVSIPRRAPAWALRAAAVLAVVLGGAGIWTLASRHFTESTREVALQEYRTGRAQRTELLLPDGTHLVLNVDSRVQVPENYGKKARDIHLEGEAAFEVQHDARRPFRVHTASAVTEVLGTRFGVRSYPEDDAVTVVVAEGRVELQPSSPHETQQGGILTAGQLGRASLTGEVHIDRDVDADALLAWTEGQLVFRNTPLRQAAAQLGRWYDLDIRLADPALEGRRLTASFDQEPVSQVLDLVALSLDLRYVREGSEVTFYADEL